MSRDLYMFWIFFRQSITMLSFIIVGYVWQILGRGAFTYPDPWAAPKRPNLNMINRKNIFVGEFQGKQRNNEINSEEKKSDLSHLLCRCVQCLKNSQVHMHWHRSSSEESSFSKPIAFVFSPPPIIIFSYGAEIFPPLVQLIGHVSALNRYIKMSISYHI